jgi:hypothetical protein
MVEEDVAAEDDDGTTVDPRDLDGVLDGVELFKFKFEHISAHFL